MPLVSEFDPRPCVLTWLNDEEHRDVLPKKSKEQRWFVSMFKEAYEETKNKTTTQSEIFVSNELLSSRIVDH